MMNSAVCIDASIVIRALTPDPLTSNAIAKFEQWHGADISLVAPSLISFEVTSTLRRMVYLKVLTPQSGEDAFARFQRMPIRISHRSGLFTVAWQMAKEFNRPRAYDAVYLAMARLYACDFWTADRRLYNAVHHELAWVKLLSHTQ